MPGVQRLRDQQEAEEGVPGVPLPEVPEDGHAQGGRPARPRAGRQAKVQEDALRLRLRRRRLCLPGTHEPLRQRRGRRSGVRGRIGRKWWRWRRRTIAEEALDRRRVIDAKSYFHIIFIRHQGISLMKFRVGKLNMEYR